MNRAETFLSPVGRRDESVNPGLLSREHKKKTGRTSKTNWSDEHFFSFSSEKTMTHGECMKKTSTPCVSYDITIPAHLYERHDDLVIKLSVLCKNWVFQKEKGEQTDYLHYQCRVRIMKKQAPSAVLKEIAPKIGGHWSVTSTTVHDGKKFNYVMKEQTRVLGPWSDQDYEEPPPLTWQMEVFLKWELLPWQAQLIEIAKARSMRDIHIIYDQQGHAGKSLFAEFLEYERIAFEMPPLRQMDDMLEFAHSFKPQTCYLIDMPRGMKKDKLAEFYSGIEVLKNGVTWDKRYSGKKRRMGRPQIIVFTNALPVFSLMSMDRWQVLEMAKESLIPYQIEDHPGGRQAPCNNGGDLSISTSENPESEENW